MKKSKIILIGILFVILITIGGFGMKSFFIGEVIRPGAIGLINTSVRNDSVQVSGTFVLESSKAYKDYSYRIDGNNLYIKIYGVLVSPFHRYGSFNINIKGDFSIIKHIYLENDKEQNCIWNE